MLISPDFEEEFSKILRNTYMAGWDVVSEPDLVDHVRGRYEMFSENVTPWIERQTKLPRQTWIEVGSGTGSSTLALAAAGANVITYEIHGPSIDAARKRLSLLGFDHLVTYTGELFGSNSTFVRQEKKADGVLLAATLEHMTFFESQEILKASWHCLKPGGLLVIIDTPNRLCSMDYHTSYLPFFAMLPPEVRLAYAKRSPRQGFNPGDIESLTRWGCGISYHEFELALGDDIHSCVVADGYEAEIVRRWPILWEDDQIRRAFQYYGLHQSIAFTRHNLFLILRKR